MAESTFRNSIQSSVRGLWSGVLTQSQFKSAMNSALHRHLTIAWNEGAKECGIEADELSEDESKARDSFISEQGSYVSDFGDRIKEVNKKSGGKLQPLFGRAEMWVNRYADAQNQAKVLACGNKKLTWILGATERHCRDCSGYSGKVFRATAWESVGARPQSSNLSCHGYRCRCRLEVTSKRASRGKPASPTG